MKRFDWALRRAPEFDAVNPETSIAILPTTAIEQHGPHLPVGTDTLIMEAMLDTFRETCASPPSGIGPSAQRAV